MTATPKLPITLAVITFNEEKNLARCLKAADFCSEIVIVDSGSTDSTLQIAESFGAKVYHREWTGYRDQKNHATAKATNEWVLCIDADEVVSPELRTDIIHRFQSEPDADAFEINRHSYYGNRLINHGGWYPQWRLFLYRKNSTEWGGLEPHTVIVFKGSRKSRLKGDLYHYTYSGIGNHITKNIAAAKQGAEAMYANGRKATIPDILFRGPWAAFRSYILRAGFLDGFYGLIISVFTFFYTFLKYAFLWEMTRQRNTKRLIKDQPD